MTPELFNALVDSGMIPHAWHGTPAAKVLDTERLRLAVGEGENPQPIGYVLIEGNEVTAEYKLPDITWHVPGSLLTKHETPAGEPERIEYRSCDIVLELYVTWTGPRGRCIEFVLAQLPPELLHDYPMARAYVTPFVDAVRQQDPTALEELRRALRHQRDRKLLVSDGGAATADIPEAMYDATVVG